METQAFVQPLKIPTQAYWSAVLSLFMGVTSLIAAEFIPVSLLTLIARDMHITEGITGQSVTVVGCFAVVASLTLAPLTQKIDRRQILLSLSALLIISNILVAISPNYPTMLIGRAFLGVCVGGFWSMASAVVLQLVPAKDVPRALSIIYAGVSVATVISLPLASYLGHLIGWRNVYLLVAFLGMVALTWQFTALPSLQARAGGNFSNMLSLLKQDWVLIGIAGTILSYGGYHIFFTYLRPFLENDLMLSANALAKILLAFGIANCLGTFIAGFFSGRHFSTMMISIHIILSCVALSLFFSHGHTNINIMLAITWGFMFGFIPVGWSTWITRTVAQKAELAGGLSVAAIQFSIGLAAAIGGAMFDNLGIKGIFITAAIIFLVAACLIKVSFLLYAKVKGQPA